MQRAVLLYNQGVNEEKTDHVEEALSLLAQVDVASLEDGVPPHEINGIRLWMDSIRAWCLKHLGRSREAVSVAREVLQLASSLDDSDRDVSRALGLLQACQEADGQLAEALETTEARVRFCERRGPHFAEDGAEAAREAGRILLRMAPEKASNETVNLAVYWYERALKDYKSSGNAGRVAEIEEELSTLRRHQG
jgi:tetratricopeptide (TPR) repeat protein